MSCARHQAMWSALTVANPRRPRIVMLLLLTQSWRREGNLNFRSHSNVTGTSDRTGSQPRWLLANGFALKPTNVCRRSPLFIIGTSFNTVTHSLTDCGEYVTAEKQHRYAERPQFARLVVAVLVDSDLPCCHHLGSLASEKQSATVATVLTAM